MWATVIAIGRLGLKSRRRGVASRVSLDLAVVLATVAATLRSGGSVSRAWSGVGIECDARGVPAESSLLQVCSAPNARASPADLVEAIRAARMSCVIAVELGTPLSDVLDHVAASVQSHQVAVQSRRSALAGPRSSVRVLMWLPLGTVGLGVLLGAAPWQVMFDGGLGTLSALAGGMLMVAGRRWVEVLAQRAARISHGEGSWRSRLSRGARVPERSMSWRSSRPSGSIRRSCPTGWAVALLTGRPLADSSALVRVRSGEVAAPDPEIPLADELVITVVLSAVNSGAALLRALHISGTVLQGHHGAALTSFTQRVSYGTSWDEAASGSDGVIGRVLTALGAAWNHGASAQVTLTRLIDQTRRDRDGATGRAAARLGVQLVLPLGLCFLPAFVLVGLVPLALSLGM